MSLDKDNTNSEFAISDLKIAAILDEFSYEAFKYECKLIPLGIKNWQDILLQEKPDILLVESAWRGNNDQWRYKIANLQTKKNAELETMVKIFKENNVPTVFWGKEDPGNFDAFIEAAKFFDYVFTTDSDCIPKYEEILGHNNVYVLPFAVQPRIHNPIDKDKQKLGKVAFAGTWYTKKYPERRRNMELLLKPAIKYGLHIYDRAYNLKSNSNMFPDEYKPYIKGYLPYQEMLQVYKKYDVFLNVNTDYNSPTMFSRRIFELLGCGINIISSYSVAVEQLAPDIVNFCSCQEDTEKQLINILENKGLRDKLSLLGQRLVFNKHTYRHRLETILDKIGLNYKKEAIPGVTVVTSTIRQHFIDNVFKNYDIQNYENKEHIIILNKNSMNMGKWTEKSKKYKNIRIFRLDEEQPLGACLNFAIDKAKFEYIAKFDDDNYYAPNYLSDLMNAFKYTDAEVVGKRSTYIFAEGSKTLAIRFPEQENQYVHSLSGSAIIARKEVFNKIKFVTDRQKGSDTQFIKDCRKNGFKLYSTDRFNHVVGRRPSTQDHTWKLSEEEYLKKCEIIAQTNNYKEYVTV